MFSFFLAMALGLVLKASCSIPLSAVSACRIVLLAFSFVFWHASAILQVLRYQPSVVEIAGECDPALRFSLEN